MGKKRRGDRYDATRVDLGHDEFKAIFPYLMRGRNDSIAYYPITIEVENLLEYLGRVKGTDKQITFFEAVLIALIKILRECPTLNRYIMGRRLYQRHDIELGFVARRDSAQGSAETNVFLRVKEGDDLASVLAQLRGRIGEAKSGKDSDDDKLIKLFMSLPRFAVRILLKLLEWWDFYVDTPKFLRGVDPLRSSAYLANLGSVGMGAAYHHLFEWGTCSLFITIGQIKPTVVVGEDGTPTVRKAVELRVALDERIADGYYDARALDSFITYFQDPEQLETL